MKKIILFISLFAIFTGLLGCGKLSETPTNSPTTVESSNELNQRGSGPLVSALQMCKQEENSILAVKQIEELLQETISIFQTNSIPN